MADVIKFHEYKFEEFMQHVQESEENRIFLADLQRKAKPSLSATVNRMENVVGQSLGTSKKFIGTMVRNLDLGRREEEMSSWQASPDAENKVRQFQIERCAAEFYQFCAANGLEKECQDAGLNLSQRHSQSSMNMVSPAIPSVPTPLVPQMVPSTQTALPNFIYTDASGQRRGPINEQQLRVLVAQGVIVPQTPMETEVGHKGLAGQVPGLFAAVQTSFVQSSAPVPMVQSVEASFMQRCPEIDLSVIPEARRTEFMQQYENLRPKLEGNNVMVYLTEQEIAADPSLRNFAIERLQHVNLNGVQAIYCRVHNGGTPLYNLLLGNVSSAIVASYQKRSGIGILGIASLVMSIIGIFTAAIGLGRYLGDPDA